MQKKKNTYLVTLFLCLFLGHLGIHRFYVGKTGTGILMFFTAGGLGLWYLLDICMIISRKFTTKEGNAISWQIAAS